MVKLVAVVVVALTKWFTASIWGERAQNEHLIPD